jgi:hypothetical protein
MASSFSTSITRETLFKAASDSSTLNCGSGSRRSFQRHRLPLDTKCLDAISRVGKLLDVQISHRLKEAPPFHEFFIHRDTPFRSEPTDGQRLAIGTMREAGWFANIWPLPQRCPSLRSPSFTRLLARLNEALDCFFGDQAPATNLHRLEHPLRQQGVEQPNGNSQPLRCIDPAVQQWRYCYVSHSNLLRKNFLQLYAEWSKFTLWQW